MRILQPTSIAILLLASAACRSAPNVATRPVPAHVATIPAAHVEAAARNDVVMRRAKEHPDARVVFLGDSITEGWEGAGKEIWAERYLPRRAIDLGVGGDRTEHVLARLEAGQLDGLRPEVIVLMIGTNNTGHRRDEPAKIADGVAAILQQCLRRAPDARILLLAIFPRGGPRDDALRRNNDLANERIRGFADGETIVWCDLAPAFLEREGRLSTAVMPDLLHLSEDGYRRWGDAMEPTLAKMLR